MIDPVDDVCVFEELAVGGTGYRRLLRFETVIINAGGGDLVVGSRSDPDNPYPDYFYFGGCHGHNHISDFTIYELLTPDGQQVVRGEKQGFYLEDSFKYGNNNSSGYNCD